ncbi:hypothetical protein NEOLEDRAFT_489049 [Neolentinus lepideus HHB14362 ss-1]|uniref:Uncharacterized protein n=1 Tax=Neolentinus lepideus HHB14362 ss-1 TaxID=1314782 RepID=A0A165VP01_9AGAM|nr:hypothetical protein NEOLEDRAFT_489049 [Neolentinus lepideus HHB14362 ss-1]
MAPLPPPPPPSNGLLSNVFNFVSRELESFVANATGGESSQQVPISQPETSDSRVKVTRSKRTKHNDGNSRVHETSRPEDKPPLPRVSTRREPLSQSLKCLHEPQNYHQPSKRTSRRSLNESKSSSPARDSRCNGSHKGSGGESLASTVTASDHVPDHNENSRPCTPPRNLKRQKSFTMPGALFPMSPSVEPESPPLSPTLEGEDRQVHFTPSPSHPAPKRSRSSGVTLLEEHGESVTSSPSYRRSKHRKTMDGRSRSSERMPPPSPAFRPSAIASVQDAIRKFQPGPDEAGPSILLPNSPSPSSPTKPRDKGRETTGTNGANKTIDPEVEEILASSSSRSSKGKGKEREDPRRYGFEGPDSSGVLRIWGKERELSVAIEEQRRKEREWTLEPESDRDRGRIEGERRRDKERIRHLEEEVRRLKDELARRPVVNPSTDFRNPLPPPPPPAPPIGIAPRAPADTSAATDAILMAARASLRHAGTPKEAPINAGPMAARTRRTGQPTVNVPSEKMAAFLNEMKTVRLRKVSSGESAAPRPPSSMGENAALSKSFSVDSRPRDRAFELAVERGSVSMDAAQREQQL